MRVISATISRRGVAAGMLAIAMVLAATSHASACGWWGDGEDNDDDAITIGADGQPVSPAMPVWNLSDGQDDEAEITRYLEVPEPRSGYGIIVQADGSAVPYLKAVPGQRAYSIQQLYAAGFLSVIDLGTPPMVAALHRQETEELGMKYFNIPMEGDVPGKEHVTVFGNILAAKENLPILVFSASVDLLGGLWASHRMNVGVSRQVVISETRNLGLPINATQSLTE